MAGGPGLWFWAKGFGLARRAEDPYQFFNWAPALLRRAFKWALEWQKIGEDAESEAALPHLACPRDRSGGDSGTRPRRELVSKSSPLGFTCTYTAEPKEQL